MLKKVIESLTSQKEFENWKDHFYVFDNASTFGNTKEYLRSSFKNVLLAEENYGYWSAVNWVSEFARNHGYDYIYIMESDCVHHDIEQLRDAVRVLEENSDLGMVRTAEFSLANKHLYDKDQRHAESKTCEWFRQSNFFTGRAATYSSTQVENVYKTNLVAKVCGLHRISSLKKVFDQLIDEKWFTEVEFQKFYHQDFPLNAILDGGIYNSTPAYEPNVVAGSLVVEKIDTNGYRKTREGFVTPISEMKVSS